MQRHIKTTILLLAILQTALFSRDINIDDLVNKANKSKKDTFIFLHRTDCGYCDSMIMFTLDDDIVRPMLEKDFFVIDININDEDKIVYKDFTGNGRDFARHVEYDFYPSSLFLDANNNIIYGVAGKQDENEFLITLRYVKSKAYLKMNIDDSKPSLSEKE